MRKVLVVVLSVAAIVSAVEVVGHQRVKGQSVVMADGSDPMPFCRKTNCPTLH